MGFEPTVPFGITGFQDQLLKPLGHLSKILYVASAFIADLYILSLMEIDVNTFFNDIQRRLKREYQDQNSFMERLSSEKGEMERITT